MNVTPDRPCSAYFHVSKEFTSKDIFDSLSADGISVKAVKCLQRKTSGDVMLTFSNPEHCLRFIECSSLIIRRGNVRFSTHPASGELTYLTIYDAPFELPDSAIIKRLAPYCRVYSSRLGKLQEYPDVYNGIRHYRVALGKSVPCYLRFGRFQVRFYHNDQTKTCRKCGDSSHIARDCTNDFCFNCDSIGHISKHCPEKVRCCICKSEAHMAVDCEFSWYRRPVLNANAESRPDEQSRETADQNEQEPPSAREEPVPEPPVPSQDAPPDPQESAQVPMDESPDPDLSQSTAPGAALDSQGLLLSQDVAVELPPRPTNVCPSSPDCTLSEDLYMTDDEDEANDDSPDVASVDTSVDAPADSLASSSSGSFVFPESLPLASVAKKFKAARGKLGRRAPAKILPTSQPPLRKATHPVAHSARRPTVHPATKKSAAVTQQQLDEHLSEQDPG